MSRCPSAPTGLPARRTSPSPSSVVEQIPDGAVLSLGVGGVPYTVAKMLAESDKKDLGLPHRHHLSDAFLELYKAGKLTNARKELDTGLSAWNLAMGCSGAL